MGSAKLEYRVVFCSGSEAEYPGSELNRHSPQTRGWQSARFCDYPQTIVLDLERPSQVRQVQFLSHQSKIASRIELYVGSDSAEYETSRFSRLGYVSLDPNERSQYQARELKSVFVECSGRYLKLVVHRCHINRENLFNQVSIVAVNVLGESQCQRMVQANPTDLAHANDIQGPVAQWIAWLVDERDRAVGAEDYDEASRLKDSEAQLRVVGAQLAQLKAAKARAVEVEDYDRAKVIKDEIEQVALSAQAIFERARARDVESPADVPEDDEPAVVSSAEVMEEPSVMPQPEENDSVDEGQGETAPELEGVPNNADLPTPEPLAALSHVETSEVAAIGAVIGQYRLRCLFSKNWLLRDAVLVKLRLMVDELDLDRLCAASKIGVDDKIPQVYFSAVALLHACGKKGASRQALEPGVLALIAKLADNQPRVRDRAFDALADLAPAVGCGYLGSLLLKTLDKKHLVHNKWRPIAARLGLLEALVQLDPHCLDHEKVFEFLRVHDCPAHTSAPVRNHCRDLVTAIGKQLTDDQVLVPLLRTLRPKQRQEYEVALGRSVELPDDAATTKDIVPKNRHTPRHQESEASIEPSLDPAQQSCQPADEDEEQFRDLIMKQLEEQAFSIEEAYNILKQHFDAENTHHDDRIRRAVLREWCAEIGSGAHEKVDTSVSKLDQRDQLLRQVATWLFQ